MAEEKVVVTMDNFQQRVAVKGLNEWRNILMEEDLPTEDVDDVLMAIIDAPTEKQKKKADREAR